MDPEDIRRSFLTNAEPAYREFNTKIVVPGEHKVIGIKIPVIRNFAKENIQRRLETISQRDKRRIFRGSAPERIHNNSMQDGDR